jgi:hypothetical protein
MALAHVTLHLWPKNSNRHSSTKGGLSLSSSFTDTLDWKFFIAPGQSEGSSFPFALKVM